MLIKDCDKYKKYYDIFKNNDIFWLLSYVENLFSSRVHISPEVLLNFENNGVLFDNACFFSAVLKIIGESLDVKKIEDNPNAIVSVCNIYYYCELIFGLFKVDNETKNDSLNEFRQKIISYLVEKLSVLKLELPDKKSDQFYRVLYLALKNSLSKDTYFFSKYEIDIFGNFPVMIDFYKYQKEKFQQENYENNNELQESKFIASELISFGYGLVKLKNVQCNHIQRCVYDWLISKGYSKYNAYLIIRESILKEYNKYNLLCDEKQYVLPSGKIITFKRTQRYPKESYSVNIDRIFNDILNFPPEIQDLVDNFVFFDEANVDNLYWEEAYNTCNFVSHATSDWKNKTINYFSIDSAGDIKYELGLLLHEYGHAYDYHLAKEYGLSEELFSSSLYWQEAMQKDFELSNQKGVSEYALNHTCEDFAESFSKFFTFFNSLNQFPNRQRLLCDSLIKKDAVRTQ